MIYAAWTKRKVTQIFAGWLISCIRVLSEYHRRGLAGLITDKDKWMVEGEMEIISGARKRASAFTPGSPVTGLPELCARRDKIAPQYTIADPLLRYGIVNKNIPVQAEELKTLIDKLENCND